MKALFTVVESFAVDVLLGIALINELIFAIIQNIEKVTIRNSTPVAIMKRCNVSVNVLFTKKTKNHDINTYFKAKENQGSAIKHSSTVRVTMQKLPKSFFVTLITVATKVKRLLYFVPDLNLVTQGCWPTKRITEAVPNLPFFILVTNTSTKQQHFNKHKLPRRLSDDITTIFSTETLLKSPRDEQ